MTLNIVNFYVRLQCIWTIRLQRNCARVCVSRLLAAIGWIFLLIAGASGCHMYFAHMDCLTVDEMEKYMVYDSGADCRELIRFYFFFLFFLLYIIVLHTASLNKIHPLHSRFLPFWYNFVELKTIFLQISYAYFYFFSPFYFQLVNLVDDQCCLDNIEYWECSLNYSKNGILFFRICIIYNKVPFYLL